MLTIAELARATERVFPTHARVERYYPAGAAQQAREILGRCLDRGEGPALLIGSPGTGKSMLLNVLADDLGQNRPVVFLTSAQLCTRRALLQSILFELGQPYRQRDEGDLRLALMDYLKNGDVTNSGVLLLVDEAQSLPIRLLEELRILGNVAHRGVPIVRLLLAGSAPLEETFSEPEVEAFNQRIAARCYLSPLSHHDTAQYVRGHLAAAGANPDELFTADALDAVYRATDGIARLVNQVCDRALVLAAAHQQTQVSKQLVEGAWADLQQLPTPWNLPEVPDTCSGDDDDDSEIVEFGPLSEDSADDSEEKFVEATFEQATTARLHEPEEELELELELEEQLEVDLPEVASVPQAQPSAPTTEGLTTEEPTVEVTDVEVATNVTRTQPFSKPVAASDSSPASTLDDLFGGDEFEEEVIIDEFKSFEQTIPPSRPRVTSACEAELSQMLHEVIQSGGVTEDAPIEAAQAEPDEVIADREETTTLPSFGIVDIEVNELHDVDEIAPDGTELDDETDQVLAEINAIADEAQDAADAKNQPAAWQGDELEILVIEDEMSTPMDTAAAHRADYRQLFKTLRED
ncbi:AAA family ATPase [Aeoliella sp. ICT_H6.2]|uniref:AAA family ATPase n=1 Tax=Aeoliella straminimaris TaxID=2954799 RepID=A0A9X2FE46_9BACT|nr:AAA family ATPase [Aeoliella straminimaris]MCO6042511.1 AAA family ATPase [Aeoliella straminimaris]